ncbi:MAG: carbohydrate ABC transporter permease [Pseudomonadota bacterium]
MSRRRKLKDAGLDAVTLVAVILLLFPVIWVIVASFKPNSEILAGGFWPEELTFEHYRAILGRSDFLIALRNSLIVGLASAIVSTLVALPAAYSLARFKYRGREGFGMLILSTQMLPSVAILVPLVIVMRSLELSNTLTGLAITHLTLGLPIAVWMLRGYIAEVPVELEEAAMIDGCSRLGAMVRVVLPLVAPAIVAVATFAFVLSWGEYLLALALISSTDVKTLPLALQALFDPYSFSWGEVMAGGVVIALPAIILFQIVRRYMIGGLVAGGVKG